MSLLVETCAEGNQEKVRQLLLEGADVNQRDQQGDTALHLTCLHGNEEILEMLLRHPSIDLGSRSRLGGTPLLLGSVGGHGRVVQRLLEDQRVDPNQSDDFGKSPLWMAAFKGHMEVVMKFVACGRELRFWERSADFTSEYPCCSPAEVADQRGFKEVASLLKRFEANQIEVRDEIRAVFGLRGSSFFFPLILLSFNPLIL